MWRVLFVALPVALCRPTAGAERPVSDLKATARDGQVFLVWKEADTPAGTTFNVYASSKPITVSTLGAAKKIGHHIERHSARDWWEDPASFSVKDPSSPPVGFRIADGEPRLDPAGGLFVHTVSKEDGPRGYYAVTVSEPDGKESRKIAPGVNSLSAPVSQKPGEIAPIWQHDGAAPARGAGSGKPLSLVLHAKGGVVKDSEYLVFGDESTGWREGLPFKFSVRLQGEEVVVQPTDRAWLGRTCSEQWDTSGRTPAIWTFWYGYNSKIYDPRLMGEGVPTNYTEQRNLWILKWVRERYGTDANRCYCSGSSMGGCGTVSFGLRHPEIFAALHAHVPIVSYTQPGQGSARRLEPICWTGPFPDDLKTNEGIPILDRMNGERLVTNAKDDLPPLFLIHGRKDGSIPWANNPPFYRALERSQQAFSVYWDDGEHATCGKDAPEDVKAWAQTFRRIRLDESFPAFSNTSSDRNPGDGRPEDGDTIGWMNRGMGWKDVRDKSDGYAITLTADFPEVRYPVKTDVTLRRVQRFKTQPGEKLAVQVGGGSASTVKAGKDGRIHVPGVAIPSAEGVRITIRRAGR